MQSGRDLLPFLSPPPDLTLLLFTEGKGKREKRKSSTGQNLLHRGEAALYLPDKRVQTQGRKF